MKYLAHSTGLLSLRFAWVLFAATACVHHGAPEQGAMVAGTAAIATAPSALPTRSYQKPSDLELQSKLTALAYQVTQHAATERPFDNAYWNNHEAGIYVDAATGEPLFSSLDKFDSGSGWPSFTRPLDASRLVSRPDQSLGTERTEVKSRDGNSHLGHVFNDGPGPTGERFCINSAALRFVPVNRLVDEGYGQYLPLFSGAVTPVK